MKLTAKDAKRFWSKVDRSGGPAACWPWTAGRSPYGYGKFQIGPNGGQTTLVSSRVALALKTGRMRPSTIHARHWKCDNPPCCNPRHLKWGTPKQNRHDTVRKGREPRGEDKSIAKLTNAAVRRIRRVWAADKATTHGPLVRKLAARYGVRPITVYAAASGRHNWKWLR